MIARLFARMPFLLSVPESTRFNIFDYTAGTYKARFFPPMRSTESIKNHEHPAIKIGGIAAIKADILQIDFIKESFDRAESAECDPPYAVIKEIMDEYIKRLRHVCGAAEIRSVAFPLSDWRLTYLNDDGSELEKKEGFLRSRFSKSVEFKSIALTDEIWNDVHSLPPDYSPPPWEALLFDASLPGMPIGSSLVLSYTALEVFISYILDQLAKTKTMPDGLWPWINKRPHYEQEPRVEEQYDILLAILSGHSLKEEKDLWEAFKNLRSARNSFVHTGIIKIGNSAKPDSMTSTSCVHTANLIISKVREWLPLELRWRQYKYTVHFEMAQPIFP